MGASKPKANNHGWTDERRKAMSERQKERWKSLKLTDNGKIPAKAPLGGSPNGVGLSGNLSSNGFGTELSARRRLTLATLQGMQRAFDRGGQKAIDKVMKLHPAMFLKMLVLLVPREMNIEHSGTVKEMTDQQIEDAIAAIKQMIADRERGMIDVTPVTPNDTPDEKPVE